MLTLRQKIFFNYVLIFILCSFVLYFVIPQVLNVMQMQYVEKISYELVDQLNKAPDVDAMVHQLREEQARYFFRVILLTPSRILYDTHEEIASAQGNEGNMVSSYDVVQALKYGKAYSEQYSPVFAQQMTYVSIAFSFHDDLLVLRTAFPFRRVDNLMKDFSIGLLFLGLVILLLFSIAALSIIHYFTRPIRRIIELITSYQLGKEEDFPEIIFNKEMQPNDEFGTLARTLNALSRRIKLQIAVLTQEKNEKTRLLESLMEGVITVDSHLYVTYANPVAQQFLGLSLKELMYKKFPREKSMESFLLLQEAFKKNQVVTDVVIASRPQRIYWDLIALPQKNIGGILVLQDKTSLHRVVELGKDFVANASHELKTPITIIHGFAETLLDYPHLSQEVLHNITQKIADNCVRMHTLIKNLLTLSGLDEGLPLSRVHDCDLVELIEQAKQTVETAYPAAQITLSYPEDRDCSFPLDGDLFLQALINLIDNAAKYSTPPARIRVTLEVDEDATIQVADQGIGIPPEDLERIFERFYAVDKSHSRSMGGSGLGLSIVERIIDKHKGTITVDSVVGKGTTFTIKVPRMELEP